jgi:TP901 family phage tail tape measure protein
MSSFGGGGFNIDINPVLSQSSVNRLRDSIQKSFTGLRIGVDPRSVKAIAAQVSTASVINLKFDPAQGRTFLREANAFFAANPVQVTLSAKVDKRATGTNSIVKATQDMEKFKKASMAADVAVGSLSDVTTRANDTFGTFATRLGFTTTRLAAYLVPASLIFQATRGLSIATRDVIEINRELTKLTQVLDGNSAQASEIAKRLFDFGASIGTDGKELLKVSVTLAQAGQLFANNTEAIAKTAESISKTQLLATFGSVEETTEGVIAALSQFNLTALDTNRILDITNELAKRFAVESSDIFTAVTSGGAAFSALGGSFEEFSAVVTALRQNTRLSASTIGTGINTIVQRLFRPGSVEFLRTIGVNAIDAEGNLRGFVDVLTDVANKVQDLDDISRQVTFETLFGTRQGKLGIALVGDLASKNSVTRQSLVASDSAIGSANKDLEEGLKRVDAQLQRVSTSFQNAFLRIAEDDSFKRFINDVANGLVKIASLAEFLSTKVVPSLISTGFFALLGAAVRSGPEIAKGLGLSGPGTLRQVESRSNRATMRASARDAEGGQVSRSALADIERQRSSIVAFGRELRNVKIPNTGEESRESRILASRIIADAERTARDSINNAEATTRSRALSKLPAVSKIDPFLSQLTGSGPNTSSVALNNSKIQGKLIANEIKRAQDTIPSFAPRILANLLDKQKNELSTAISRTSVAGGQKSELASARSFLAQEEAVNKLKNRLSELNKQFETVNKTNNTRSEVIGRLEAKNNELAAKRNQAVRDIERATLTPANADTSKLTPLQRELLKLKGLQTPQQQNETVISEARNRLSEAENQLAANRQKIDNISKLDTTSLRSEIQKVEKSYTVASKQLKTFAEQFSPQAGGLFVVSSRAKELVRSASNVEKTSNALSSILEKRGPEFRSSLVKLQALNKLVEASKKLDGQVSNISKSNTLLSGIGKNVTSAFSTSLSDASIKIPTGSDDQRFGSQLVTIPRSSDAITNRISDIDSRLDQSRTRSQRVSSQFAKVTADSIKQNQLISDEIKSRSAQIRQVIRDVIKPLRKYALKTGDLTSYNAAVSEARRQLDNVRSLKSQQAIVSSQIGKSTADLTNLSGALANEQKQLLEQRSKLETQRLNDLVRQSRLAQKQAVNDSFFARNSRATGKLISSASRGILNSARSLVRNPTGLGIIGITAGSFAASRLPGEVNNGESSFNNIDNILSERGQSARNLGLRDSASTALSFGAAGLFAGGPIIGGITASIGLLVGAFQGAEEAFTISYKRLQALTRQGIFDRAGEVNTRSVRALNLTRGIDNFSSNPINDFFLSAGSGRISGAATGLASGAAAGSIVGLIAGPIGAAVGAAIGGGAGLVGGAFANNIGSFRQTRDLGGASRGRQAVSIGEFARSDEGVEIARQTVTRIALSATGRRLSTFGGQIDVGSNLFRQEATRDLRKAGLSEEAIEAVFEAILINSREFNTTAGNLVKTAKNLDEISKTIRFENTLVKLFDALERSADVIADFGTSVSIGTERLTQLSQISSGQGGQLFSPGAADRQQISTNLDRSFRFGTRSDFFEQVRPIAGDSTVRSLMDASAISDRIAEQIFSAVRNNRNDLIGANDGGTSGNVGISTSDSIKLQINKTFASELKQLEFGKDIQENISSVFKGLSESSTRDQIKASLLDGLEGPLNITKEALLNVYDNEIRLREQFNARLKLLNDVFSAQLDQNRQRDAFTFDALGIRSRRLSERGALAQTNILTDILPVSPIDILNSANNLAGLRERQAQSRANSNNINLFNPEEAEKQRQLATQLSEAEIVYQDQINQTRFALGKLTDQFNKLNDAVRQNIANLQTTGRAGQGEIFAAQQTLRNVQFGGIGQQLADLGLNPGISSNEFLSNLDPNDPRVRALISRIAGSPGETSRISDAAGVLPGTGISGVGRLTDIAAILETLRGAALSGIGTPSQNFAANIDQLKNLNTKTDDVGKRITDLQSALLNSNQALIDTNRNIATTIGDAISAAFANNSTAEAFKAALRDTIIRTKIEGEIGIEATITGLEAAFNSNNTPVTTIATIGILEAIADSIPSTPANADIIKSIRLTTKNAREKLKGNK